MISKARIVNVPKRLPPKLPPRNPNRGSGPLVIDASPKTSSPEDDEESSVKSGRDSNLASPPAHEEACAPRHSSEKVDGIKQVDGQDDARRSRSESPSKMNDVRLDDDDDDEPEMSNPLAKAQEARKRESMPSGNEPATNESQIEGEEETHKRESIPGGDEPAVNASQVEEDKTHKRDSMPGSDEPAKNEPEGEKQEAHKRESMSGDDVQPSSQSQTEVEEVRKRESMPGGFE
ncbi:hypothetical protein KC331_g19574 [Hortaea werneckii]|nr:hypothetical protein KC331_g19574 [Hortaea werneckii]KAI7689864.1 hypothetical protein KC353_g19406 [Hortaea werneckii]